MTDVRVELPNYKRTGPLTHDQVVALVSALRGVVQRETSSPNEAMHVLLAVMASFCMDLSADNVQAMHFQLTKVVNRLVRDFRQGKFRMQRST